MAASATVLPVYPDPPPRLDYLTYLDVDAVPLGDDWVVAMSCDVVEGEVVLTLVGLTSRSAFTFLGQTVGAGDSDGFVARMRWTDDALDVLWTLRLGGPGTDGIVALDVDSSGRVVVAGWAQDSVPTTPGAFGSSRGYVDAYVALIENDGEVLYANAFGGSGEDMATGVTFDGAGGFTVVGRTESHDFPLTQGPFQSWLRGAADEFVVRIHSDPEGSSELTYATYLGGSGKENFDPDFVGRAVASHVGHLGPDTIVVVGNTNSVDFPVTDAGLAPIQNTARIHVTVLECSDAVGPEEQLVLSSLVGGSVQDVPRSFVVEDLQTVVVGVVTWSGDFPTTPGSYRANHQNPGHDADAVILRYRLDPEIEPGGRLLYSTYLGGNQNDLPSSIAVLEPGKVLVTGSTASSRFPWPTGSSLKGPWDAFLLGLDLDATKPAGEQLLFPTLLGGSDLDQADALAVIEKADGWHAWLGGVALSTDLPVTPNAVQTNSLGGPADGFLARYAIPRPSANPPTATPSAAPSSGSAPLTVSFAAGATDPDGDSLTFGWDFDDPGSGVENNGSTLESPTHTFAETGEYEVRLEVSDGTHTISEGLVVLVDDPSPRFLRGDSNDDGKVDISDPLFTLNWLFLGGPTPGCVAATNTNGDQRVDLSDAVYMLTHLFLGGPAPLEPFPACGLGSLEEHQTLGCETPPVSCQ